jgi:hypothetical protein
MLTLVILMPISANGSVTCKGRFVNPISDIYWSCLLPISIGDLKPGTKFESTSIADVLRRIIYPYLAPECTLKLLNSSRYVEVGSYPSIQ